MAIAVFGPKTFTVSQNRLYTFDEFSHTSALNVEEQEVDGAKPSSYIKGSGLDEVNFTIPLIRQKQVNIRLEEESWRGLKDSAKPYLLLIGNRPLSKNKFLLINVQLTDVVIDKYGNYQKAKINLQFKEFVRYGRKKEDGKKTKAGTKSSRKKEKKRENSNADISKSDKLKMAALDKEIFGGK